MSWTGGVFLGDHRLVELEPRASGGLVEDGSQAYYVIDHAEALAPFLISVVSDSDHWLFVSSNGALTAGRRSAKFALFPYTTEDKLTDSVNVSGPYTALVVQRAGRQHIWEPLRDAAPPVYRTARRLEKSTLGHQLRLTELNHDLELAFSYRWSTSHEYGFVRECTLHNRSQEPIALRVLDGLRNLLPADVDEAMQAGFSCLLDAYKQSALVAGGPLALYTLAAQVVDRAEPRESLHATSVWSHGLPGARIHLSSEHQPQFAAGASLKAPRPHLRGRRGAYLLEATLELQPGEQKRWFIVADVARSQHAVSELLRALATPELLLSEVLADVERGTEHLRQVLSASDGLQYTADRLSSWHHTANVLFNDLRGGIYASGYDVPVADFTRHVQASNQRVYARHRAALDRLPRSLSRQQLAEFAELSGDADLLRLSYEYLPLTFSRRHGDPSRPWNRFEIRVRDPENRLLLGFQGNWRDIFQNWEALSVSYPDFVENIIVKFVNASTVDGYNPYRISQDGIEWEVPEPDHPWASIGYWGDHQIIYLCRLLELSKAHHPTRVQALLEREIFSYADVPYRIRSYRELLHDARDTIVFDVEKHERLLSRATDLGSDAKLLWNGEAVVHVTLLEKLLVSVLCKFGNFVPGGGIWLNTGRPEWNDANNALVGSGLSMVTLYHLERFLCLLSELTSSLSTEVTLSREVAIWLVRTIGTLRDRAPLLRETELDDRARRVVMDALGGAASEYREQVYAQGPRQKVGLAASRVSEFIALAKRWLRHSIVQNRRADGLYHAYNLLAVQADGSVAIERLYEMLEGQVAILSTPGLSAEEAARVLQALATSRMYRADQNSFMLYPDRELSPFLAKNVIEAEHLASSAVLSAMLEAGDTRLVRRDAQGHLRFLEQFYNAQRLSESLVQLQERGTVVGLDAREVARILEIYEQTFGHKSFTGRSGTMFAYEGLGSIYWHMVAKLLLATSERVFSAADSGSAPQLIRELAQRYYAVRDGLGGVSKTPSEYGAFPLDPYSHSPGHAGARQPGMTGQVKEEVITRLAELGVRVHDGQVEFRPLLLRSSEFLGESSVFHGFDVTGQPLLLKLHPGTLAFSYCGLPVVYHQADEARLELSMSDGSQVAQRGTSLSRAQSAEVFGRTGHIRRLDVWTQAGLSA